MFTGILKRWKTEGTGFTASHHPIQSLLFNLCEKDFTNTMVMFSQTLSKILLLNLVFIDIPFDDDDDDDDDDNMEWTMWEILNSIYLYA